MTYHYCRCQNCGAGSGRSDFDRLCIPCWSEQDRAAYAPPPPRPQVTIDTGGRL